MFDIGPASRFPDYRFPASSRLARIIILLLLQQSPKLCKWNAYDSVALYSFIFIIIIIILSISLSLLSFSFSVTQMEMT